MGFRNEPRRPARRPAFRDPRKIILIVCEGQRTEPEYFAGFSKHFRNSRVQLRIIPGAGEPRAVVERARDLKRENENDAFRERDENLLYDAVWCLVDVDDHPRLHEAVQIARDNEIRLAISNPSFELWLLLHFRESPGAQHRDNIASMLKTYVKGYAKGVTFDLYASGYENAKRRAERLCQLAIECRSPNHNPSTNVHELAVQIEEKT